MDREKLLGFIRACTKLDSHVSDVINARSAIAVYHNREYAHFIDSMIAVVTDKGLDYDIRFEAALQIQRCLNDSHKTTFQFARENWSKLSEKNKNNIQSKLTELFSNLDGDERYYSLYEAIGRCIFLVAVVDNSFTFLKRNVETVKTGVLGFQMIGYVAVKPERFRSISDEEVKWLFGSLKKGLMPIAGTHSEAEHNQHLVALQSLEKWIDTANGLSVLRKTGVIGIRDLLILIQTKEMDTGIIKLGFDCIFALSKNNICDIPETELTSILSSALIRIMSTNEENSCIEAVKFLYKMCFAISDKISHEDLLSECLFSLGSLQNMNPPMPSAKAEVDCFFDKLDEFEQN